MSSLSAACDAVDEALDKLAAVSGEVSSTAQCRQLLARMESWCRRVPSLQHELLNELREHATAEELGGKLSLAVANDLRITKGEARRRLAEAEDLGSRTTLTGQPLPPRLEHTAAGQAAGAVSGEHVRIIRRFFERLPSCVDAPTRADAERRLAAIAARYRPDELQRFADRYELVLNPDGTFTDEDRARRRGLSLGPQAPDGMSWMSGWVTPEARAGWEAVGAKWAAPGMCNPADEKPIIAGTPSQQAIDNDRRTAAQRRHDAFVAMTRSMLSSGEMGSHQGLPVTIVGMASVEDLQNKTGVAHTATGTQLPVTDLIRMSAHAYHYLLLFDKAKPMELYKGRTTRCATPAQRLVLYATERGCSRPGCDVPAAWCEVHHATQDWAQGGRTDITDLTLACGPDNRLINEDGWTTRKNDKRETEWIPPPELDTGQPRTNTYWHPEKMLPKEEDDEPH